MKSFGKTLVGSLLALSIGNAFAATDSGIEHNTQAFLDALNAGGERPLSSFRQKMPAPY